MLRKIRMTFFFEVLFVCIFVCTGCGKTVGTSDEKENNKKEAEEPTENKEFKIEDQKNSQPDWRDIYKQVISSMTDEQSGYGLIYIDDDDIPELYISGDTTASGDRLYYISGEELNETVISSGGLSYWEYQGVFMDEGGRMDGYWNTFYKIENGTVTQTHQGTYGAEDNTNVQLDASGNPIYHYRWDGTEVSSDEYYAQMNAAEGMGISFFGYEKSKSKESILAQLNSAYENPSSGQELRKAVSGSINIRSLPRHDSELAGTIESDSEIIYYAGLTGYGPGSDGVDHDWFKITTEDGITGWVRGDLVVTEGVIQTADNTLRYLLKKGDGAVNIRSLPRHDSELVGTIEDANEQVAFYGEIGTGLGSDGVMHTWYIITTEGGVTGWVRSDLVEEIHG